MDEKFDVKFCEEKGCGELYYTLGQKTAWAHVLASCMNR